MRAKLRDGADTAGRQSESVLFEGADQAKSGVVVSLEYEAVKKMGKKRAQQPSW